MDILSEPHKLFLTDLFKSGVNFILIGGYAVNFHGYPRYTADMDIWLKPSEENKIKFADFLAKKNFSSEGIKHILSLNFTQAIAFHIGKGETKIDFLTLIAGVNFNEAEKEIVFLPLKDIMIPVIHYDHLIKNKSASARLQDKADVDSLQKINQFKNKK